MHSLRVAAALLRVSLLVAMRYRVDFLTDGAMGFVRAGLSVLPTLVVFQHRDAIGGWGAGDVLLVLGLYFLMHGLFSAFVEPNLGEIAEGVRTGALDALLLRPADAQLLASVRRVQPSALWDVVAAGVVVVQALAWRGWPSAAAGASAAFLFACGLVALYQVWLLAICASFWFVKVDNLRFALWSIVDAGRNPISVYGGVGRALLTAVLPVALVTSVPVSAVRGEASAATLLGALGLAVAFSALGRWVWTRALAEYTSASS